VVETGQFTLEPSHGLPPVAVVLANTPCEDEDPCVSLSAKPDRSIDRGKFPEVEDAPVTEGLPDPKRSIAKRKQIGYSFIFRGILESKISRIARCHKY
jgi:hypothetical protein